ncbi:MAG: hypothetical protein FWD97_09045 [Defluviitaleaceae bacterium]|nr:hypothetical protein [Defluviitaleaceae bacterium]
MMNEESMLLQSYDHPTPPLDSSNDIDNLEEEEESDREDEEVNQLSNEPHDYAARLYPSNYSRVITNIEELYYFGATAVSEKHKITDGSFIITRTIRLPFNAPEVIRLGGFEMDGMTFEFLYLRQLDSDGATIRHHEIIVEAISYTSDLSEILPLFAPFHELNLEGYTGILELVEGSLATMPAPMEWERFYIEYTRTYPSRSFGDTNGFEVYFIRDGIAFTISNIDWQPISGFLYEATGETADVGVDMNDAIFNAIVTYQGWYSVATIPRFTTQAIYRGELFNFQHFPSVLYEVQFIARLERDVTIFDDEGNVILIAQRNVPEYTEGEDYHITEQQPQSLPQAPESSGIRWGFVMLFLALIILAGIALLGLRKGWFKRKKDGDEDDFWNGNDND